MSFTSIKQRLLYFWNLWPPFLFAGIKAKPSKDYRYVKVKLKLRFWNANYLGTQYGGSIFSMTDPFYMIMLIKNLGPGYSVWDKSASINYLKPGRTDLFAEFQLSEEDLQSIRTAIQEVGKIDWTRRIEIKDKNGALIAEVEKVLSIKRRGR